MLKIGKISTKKGDFFAKSFFACEPFFCLKVKLNCV